MNKSGYSDGSGSERGFTGRRMNNHAGSDNEMMPDSINRVGDGLGLRNNSQGSSHRRDKSIESLKSKSKRVPLTT